MLTRGNRKLGHTHIWAFTLPSGTDEVCPGRTEKCSRHCYARRLEKLRPKAHKAYLRNLHLSRRKDFSKRIYYFARAMRIRTIRIHVGGDFYSDEYAHKWLKVIRHLPNTQFYFYSRSWRIPSIRLVLEEMAQLPNCSAWFSCDVETGYPRDLSPLIRVAWLQTEAQEAIPKGIDLVFRKQSLRRIPIPTLSICPEQDGIVRSRPVTCERCQWCFRSASHFTYTN